MTYSNRVELYKRIEAARGRPLISYVTSLRPLAEGGIAQDVIPQFIKQLNMIPAQHEKVDLLVVSNGGDPIVSAQLVCYLRERFRHVSVLLPFAAYSAATLLALGADELIMHPYSNLGPVDPQFIDESDGPAGPEGTLMYSAEDLRAYFDFVKSDVGLSDEEHLVKTFVQLSKAAGAINLGIVKRSAQLHMSLSEKLLSAHMSDTNKVKAIAEALNRSFYHHGYPVGRKEAREMGLPVRTPTTREDFDLENCLWQVWSDVEHEMQCGTVFSPLEIALQDESYNQAWEILLQWHIHASLTQRSREPLDTTIVAELASLDLKPLDYDLLQIVVESVNGYSEFRTKGKIAAIRGADTEVVDILAPTVKISRAWTSSL